MDHHITLNPDQQQAVKHATGPLLIVAGAGTGKTTVITQRITYLIKHQHIAPHQLLALTFTDKAAAEMLERLDEVMPLGYEEPWISTFHSFGDRVLRAEGLDVGLDPSYNVLTRSGQWILIRKNLFKFSLSYYRPLGNPTKFISALLVFFSRAQDEAISPEELIAYAKHQTKTAKTIEAKTEAEKITEIAQAYTTYQQLKIENSMLDFGDLITQTIRLFKTRPAILKRYRDQFIHILVDEFQDTNYAQFELIKLLAPPQKNSNLVVVGDDDQAIYKFRGAAVSNILDFKKQYPKAKEVVLTTNYRSIKPILDTAYELIQNNNPDRLEVKLNIDKQLQSTHNKKTYEPPQIISVPTETDETEWIIKKILELVGRENYTYKDFAILTRANSQLEPFVASLRQYGLPYQLVGNRGLFDQEEIRYLLFFLQVVANPKDSQALFQLLHTPIFNLEPVTILELVRASHAKQVSLWELVEKNPITKSIVALVTAAQTQALNAPPTKVLYKFLTSTKYLQQYIAAENIDNALKIKNLNLFLNLLKKFETDTKTAKVVEVVEYLNLLTEAGENPAQAEIEDIDTIRLITVHSAKGLEFPVVFMPSLVVGRFPAINRRDAIEFPQELIKEKLPDGNENLQEERRLFYVGITRAKEYLYLSYAKDYGGVRARHPSGFLPETQLATREVAADNQLSLLSTTAPMPAPKILPTPQHRDIKYLSYSQIDTFKTCPLKYKYRYILQVPAEPHHALSFGQSVHDTLKHFHQLELKELTPTLKDLLELYTRYFREEGYDSPEHKLERFVQGKLSLQEYFKVYKQKLGHPVHLERSFRLSIAGVPLIGKIDRIDETKTGFEIVDYKTGDASKKDVDRDEQLTIYALGAKYSLNIEPTSLSLYFLESNQKLSTTRSEKDLNNALKHLETTIEEIQNSDFPAKPGSPFPCGFCEYNKICPYAVRKK